MKARCWVLLVAWLFACGGSCGNEAVAALETRTGEVQRDVSKAREQWLEAAPGDELFMGDGLRTGPDGVARLKLMPSGTALVEPNTVMRFMEQLPGDTKERITLEEGAIELEASQLELEVHTARAIAKLPQGSRLRVSAQGAGDVQFDVLVGRVTVDHDGTSSEVTQGQSLALTPPERPGASPSTPKDAGSPPTEASAPAHPTRSDFTLPSPESATVHAATMPVDVRVHVPPCTNGPGTLEIAGPSGHQSLTPSRGSEHVVARLGAGVHRWWLRCGKVKSAQATLRVQRDPATMELPKTAPQVEVEADGRRYTVRYQNVLPVVRLTWPNAPEATRYKLTLRRKDRTLNYELKKPNHELRSGELGEGDYDFRFSSDTGGASAHGSLRIVFDNTARSAYLSSPAEGSSAEGSHILVAGAALLRSEVSVDGSPVPLDAQGRFRVTVPRDPARGTVTVRVSHPITGVHYYLRRLR